MADDLVGRLRAWGRRYEPRSGERVLMWEAAARIEALEAGGVDLSVDDVERVLGGKLLKWQRDVVNRKRGEGG